MERENVLIPQADLDRQREFEEKIRGLFAAREAHPAACVDTFGCQQNVADSQHILGMLRDMGCQFTDDAAQADIVVLNTCAIRDHAEKRVYGNLGALTHTKKQNPEQVICLCGCMAQRPEVAEKVRQSYRHVDLVFGPQALWKFPELLYRSIPGGGVCSPWRMNTAPSPRGCPWCGKATSGRGCLSCTGATTSAHTASSPTSGGGSAAGSLSASSRRAAAGRRGV